MNIADTTAGGPGGSPDPAGDAKQAIGSAKEAASSTLSAVKEETASFADAAQKRALDEIEDRKGLVGSLIGDVATGLRKACEEMEQNDRSGYAGAVRQAADQLQHLAGKVSDRPAAELVDMTREFARANPVPFAAGTLLVGFALGRFLRSSARHGETGDSAQASAPTARSAMPGAGAVQGTLGSMGGAPSGSVGGLASTPSTPSAGLGVPDVDDGPGGLLNRDSGSDTVSAARMGADRGFGSPGAGEAV